MNDKVDAAEEMQDLSKMSKYELVVIASREARRLNEAVRSTNKELKRRVTDVAWERLMEKKINFTYGEIPVVEEEFEFPELKDEETAEVDQTIDVPDLLADAAVLSSGPAVEAKPEPEPEVSEDLADEAPSFDEIKDEEISAEPLEEGLSS